MLWIFIFEVWICLLEKWRRFGWMPLMINASQTSSVGSIILTLKTSLLNSAVLIRFSCVKTGRTISRGDWNENFSLFWAYFSIVTEWQLNWRQYLFHWNVQKYQWRPMWWLVSAVNFRYPRKLWTTKFGRLCLAERFHTNRLTCQTLSWHGW